jgi:AcrR family transcriptional regulator
LGKREEAKASRRSRIVETARSIIIERGDDGFSMRRLAKESGSSLGTLYSLYGSKQNVISDLLNREVEAMAMSMEAHSGPYCVNRLFFIVDETFRRHRSLQTYLLYLLRMSYVQNTSDEFVIMRDAYFFAAISDAIAAGELAELIPAPHLAQAISTTYTGALLDYSMGRITLTQFTKHCGAGFALTLLGVASARVSPFIREKLAYYTEEQAGSDL